MYNINKSILNSFRIFESKIKLLAIENRFSERCRLPLSTLLLLNYSNINFVFQKSLQTGREYTNIKYTSDIGNSCVSPTASSGFGTLSSCSSRHSMSLAYSPSPPSNCITLRQETKKPPRAVSDIPLPR